MKPARINYLNNITGKIESMFVSSEVLPIVIKSMLESGITITEISTD